MDYFLNLSGVRVTLPRTYETVLLLLVYRVRGAKIVTEERVVSGVRARPLPPAIGVRRTRVCSTSDRTDRHATDTLVAPGATAIRNRHSRRHRRAVIVAVVRR